MTRLEADPKSLETEAVSIDEIVTETVSDCSVEAEFRGCSIRVSGQLPVKVAGDRELLRRTVENVVPNAIRYSPEQATVDLVLSETDNQAIITVRDYGPGVPVESLNRIFDPFYRMEQSRDAKTAGTGLGMSIAKRAVELRRMPFPVCESKSRFRALLDKACSIKNAARDRTTFVRCRVYTF